MACVDLHHNWPKSNWEKLKLATNQIPQTILYINNTVTDCPPFKTNFGVNLYIIGSLASINLDIIQPPIVSSYNKEILRYLTLTIDP